MQRVDYGRDFEKQLSFYAETRAAFPNLDSVHIQLVQVCNIHIRLAICSSFAILFYIKIEALTAIKSFFFCIQCVNRLSVDTRKIVRGHHTRRTSAFVRACAAFCFITIPSLTLVHTRLQLYLLSGQVALLNQCLGQGMRVELISF